MKTTLALVLLLAAAAGAAVLPGTPRTTNNDDSCDVTVMPAATLLMPYFEVDFHAPANSAVTSIFTITNVTQIPQIAHVSIWSDYGYPVIDFPLFLTGYDVEAINLYDVLARGDIAPPAGTSNTTTPGSRSLANVANPRFLPSASSNCYILPGPIPPSILRDVRSGLTTGEYSLCGRTPIGGPHRNAVGYITIDVVATCSATLPTDPAYFTEELLFDNVLIGEWMLIDPRQNYASGNPMVHIRATPEGGDVRAAMPTNLPFTFYDRFTPAANRRADRRQPLPAAWAARFIQGGPGAFNTDIQIWREGVNNSPSCGTYAANAAMPVAEVMRFDEHENASSGGALVLPLTSTTATSSTSFPPMASPAGDVGGWLYVNMASQSWVSVRMSADGHYSAGTDALPLGNGCSRTPVVGGTIAPAPNETP